MRRALTLLALTLPVIGICFFLFAPAIIERSMNKVAPTELPIVTKRVQTLHEQLEIADLHADTLLWKRDLLDQSTRGHVDLPRLHAGNVTLQIFSSVTKTPRNQNYESNGADTDNITALAVAQLQPSRTWTSLIDRSLWHAEKLREWENRSGGRLRLLRSGADVRRLRRDRANAIDVT